YLRNHFNRVQDVDRVVAFSEEHDEAMPSAKRHRVFLSKLNHRGVSAGASHQAFAGSLAEGEPKLDSRHGADQGLVDVFDGLDEMGLSEDEIRRSGLSIRTVVSCTAISLRPRWTNVVVFQ